MSDKLTKGAILSLVLVSLFIAVLIGSSFLLSENKYEISASIITLTCLLLVIVLSNSFDNFSVAKLITISRTAKEAKEKVEKLETEKNELIFKIVNNNSQSQMASSNIFVGDTVSKSLVVQKADPKEKEEETENQAEVAAAEERQPEKRIDSEKLGTLMIQKYFGMAKADSILREVKVVAQFQGVDPISDRTVYFNGYFNDSGNETFIVINRNNYFSFMNHDRLYIQLNKIYHYNNVKKTNAKLELLMAKIEESEPTPTYRNFERVRELFTPAIASGLLSIHYIDVTKDELETIYS